MKDKQTLMIHKIKKVDKILTDINLDVTVQLKKIYLGLTGDKDDYLTSN